MVHTRHFAYANQSMEKLGLRYLKIRNTKYKYRFKTHTACLVSGAFLHLREGPCVSYSLLHSRLGESRPICKVWYVKA